MEMQEDERVTDTVTPRPTLTTLEDNKGNSREMLSMFSRRGSSTWIGSAHQDVLIPRPSPTGPNLQLRIHIKVDLPPSDLCH